MNCPKCQAPLRPGAHFCPNCGFTLPQAPPGPPPPSYSPGVSPGAPPAQGQAPPPPPPQFQPPAGAPPSYPPPLQQQYGYVPPPPPPPGSPSTGTGFSFLKLLPWIGVFFAGLILGLVIGMVLPKVGGDVGKTTPTLVATEVSVTPTATNEPAPTSTPTPSSPIQGVQVGQVAPGFTLQELKGNEVKLYDPPDKVVVLVFWKDTDADSLAMMPYLNEFYQGHKDDLDLRLLTINSGSLLDSVKPLAEANRWEFQILLDEDQKQTNEYEVSFWPTTFFLDRGGIIRDRVQGVLTSEQLNEQINRLR